VFTVQPTLKPTPAPTINVPSALARIPTYSPLPHPPSVRQPTIFDRQLSELEAKVMAGSGKNEDEDKDVIWSAGYTLAIPTFLGIYAILALSYFYFY